MPAHLHPGVYVEEVPSGARAIESVGTSTAIFVGETERGPLDPTSIKSVNDYERIFGGYQRHTAVVGLPQRLTLRDSVEAFFQNGGTSAYVLRAAGGTMDVGARSAVIAASPGAWSDNVSVFYAPSSDGNLAHWKLFVLYRAPGAARHQLVETWDRLSLTPGEEGYAPDVLLRSMFVRANPMTSMRPDNDSPFTDLDSMITGAATMGALMGGHGGLSAYTGPYATLLARLDEVTDASLLVVPSPLNTLDDGVQSVARDALAYAEGRSKQDLFCIADLPRFANFGATEFTARARTSTLALASTNFGAVYGPWVEVSDPVGVGRDPTIFLGPSGFVAGLYARTDQRRGVWKAPAGLEASLIGVRRPEYKLLDVHQDDLNPVGANAIRIMPGGGNVVWGARTLRPSSEWRYVPVRRTAIFLRMSIYNSIQWAVFEPNDETLWNSLRLSVSAFMDQLFRQGAFAGATSREAYFVKCDADTTTEEDRAAGVVNVLVGFAPVRPAEFVIVKLSQITNQKS
ncbi:MAG: hypothetical protein JWM10_349 [Myxococcaceae bacterium]|nr:hypothetical protein [Myxococcaceae bacterium]